MKLNSESYSPFETIIDKPVEDYQIRHAGHNKVVYGNGERMYTDKGNVIEVGHPTVIKDNLYAGEAFGSFTQFELENEYNLLKTLNNKHTPKIIETQRYATGELKRYAVESIHGVHGDTFLSKDFDTNLHICKLYIEAFASIFNDGVVCNETHPDDFVITTDIEGKPSNVVIIDMGKAHLASENAAKRKKQESHLMKSVIAQCKVILAQNIYINFNRKDLDMLIPELYSQIDMQKYELVAKLFEKGIKKPKSMTLQLLSELIGSLYNEKNIKPITKAKPDIVITDKHKAFEKHFGAPLDPGAKVETIQ